MLYFISSADRCVQGMVNSLSLMDMVRGRLSRDPAMSFDGVPVIDPLLDPMYVLPWLAFLACLAGLLSKKPRWHIVELCRGQAAATAHFGCVQLAHAPRTAKRIAVQRLGFESIHHTSQ